MSIAKPLQMRGATGSVLKSVNEILNERQLCLETDTFNIKFGDGTSKYTDLKYINSGSTSLDGTNKIYASNNNEVNFGGTSSQPSIYFGYRAVDSRPIPTVYYFGTTGTAEVRANLNGTILKAQAATIITQDSTHRFVTDSEKSIYSDKYTKAEVDNKFSTLETNIDWKESVATFSAIATTYPSPQDGWTVNVKDTDYTYRYNGSAWIAISANAIPKATQSVDGLMSKEDKKKLDSVSAGAGIYTHPSYTVRALGLYKVAVDSLGHVNNVTAVAKADITALGIPAQDTTYGVFSASANGLTPASGGGTTKYLRADGTWQVVSGTDVNVTNTLNNTVQAYITGTTSSTTNTGTQVFDNGIYITTTAGRLHVTSLEIGNVILEYDSVKQGLKVTNK